ncbi:unnamed protein product [Paramecium pentaurelia]|uniref:RRM domain-containing protein n=1 Tax=Paramecium pentaurelia TaxID=43138 RepID=A0A8S1SLH5_9CILI|nr:unnamed protein product [Paramecium pentaurelia]
MISFSSPILSESWKNSNMLLLSLIAPPENLSPEYFCSLLNQYGPVHQVKILNKSLMDYKVLVEMETHEAAKSAKSFLDQLSSNFIKCQYYQDEKPLLSGSYNNCSLDLINDSTLSTQRCRHSTSLNDIVQEDDKHLSSIRSILSSQRIINSSSIMQPTITLCLNGIKGKNLDAQKLYNIFSNFGNIDKILLIKLKNFALIKYLKEEYSIFVFQNCQKLQFFDSVVSISFVAEDAIDQLKSLDTLYNEQDYYVGSQETDRFNSNNKMNLLPPSQVLHISNLKKVSSNAETMWDAFSEFGVVEAVKVLNTQFKFMCLVKMETLQQALEVMAQMHNEEIDNRNVQISFTKAKI